MGTSTDQVRHEIERTRQDLGHTIDEVTDRTRPRRIAERGKQRARQRLTGVQDRVMGSAEEGAHQAESRVKGNPLAAGLIAFGGGALAASLAPASRTERKAAQTLAEEAGPVAGQLKNEARQAGQELGENLKHSTRDAAQQVEQRAKESAQQVKQEAGSSAEHVRGQAQHAGQDVKHEARRQM
ncbi:Protein of unknown function [Amycolatopsis marina]|uniref:DUF3618 domain-containing protein n=1 Tax=Amycolatopsis marina TaxID=490629 RepID=A0A1I0ZTK6_9PSEU|nr:DUF3618 domain-containing protein [Amycolatopsis marina]SFB29054.1 Protein of unknown function [Amycolatopsis marina]